MKNNTIVIFIEAVDHCNFFTRMNSGLEDLGYNTIFITLKLSLFYRLKQQGIKCRLIRNTAINYASDINFDDTIEFKGKFQDKKDILKTYNSIYHNLEIIHSSENIGLIFIFGGYSVSGLVLEDFSAQNKISKLYFELSNIPGKIFVDSMGTNARSSIFFNSNLLDNYSIDESIFEIWINGYINIKLKQKDIPQTENMKPINWGYFLDWFGFFFLRIPRGANRGVITQIRNKFLIKFFNVQPDKIDLTNKKYIFYPLQVSTDAQVLINSNFTNSTAIDYADEIARKNKLILVIKLHPAEKSYDEIRILKKLKKEKGFFVSDENTFELITDSAEVITINSTVGLESLILEKKVTVLGNSFYKNFTRDQLKKYLLGFLVEIDFFSKGSIPREKVNFILQRIDLQ